VARSRSSSLEDTAGRVEVKVRQQQIESYGAILNADEPVLVSGKVSFPMTEDDAEDSGPKEPTLLLDEAVRLSDAIRAETRTVTIRLTSARTRREHIQKLAEILRASPPAEQTAGCPVQLVIRLDDGAEAILQLSRELRVDPSDAMLAGLEKLFGEKVAHLG
jgi:DNA polymerase-3 subunit alpha